MYRRAPGPPPTQVRTALSFLLRRPLALLPLKAKALKYPGLFCLSPHIQNTLVVKCRVRAPQYFGWAKHCHLPPSGMDRRWMVRDTSTSSHTGLTFPDLLTLADILTNVVKQETEITEAH